MGARFLKSAVCPEKTEDIESPAFSTAFITMQDAMDGDGLMGGATLRLRLLLISSIKQIGKLDGRPSRPSRPLSSWTKEEVGGGKAYGGHEQMMSAQAGFAMVRKLCKGGCVKMKARGKGSIEYKKAFLCAWLPITSSHPNGRVWCA